MLKMKMSSFSLGLGIVFTVVEEHQTEDEDTSNHAESAGVVRVGTDDESFVLRVLQRSDWHLQKRSNKLRISIKKQDVKQRNHYLSGAVEEGVTNPCIINFKLVDAVDVGDRELGAEESVIATLQNCSYKWIDANKLELNILGVKRSPFSLFELFNFNCVNLWLTK